jgi:branched-chain amino acid transport system substrate-binding protein
MLQRGIEGAKSIKDDDIAAYLSKNTMKTIMGDIKYGANGEWAESGMMQVQYHDIKSGSVDQFKGMDTQTVLTPDKFKTGNVIYPFEKAKQ